MVAPHCKKCDKQVVESSADFKTYFYCRTCKVEVDAFGYRIRNEKAMEMDSYMFEQSKSNQASQDDLDWYFSAPYLDPPNLNKK